MIKRIFKIFSEAIPCMFYGCPQISLFGFNLADGTGRTYCAHHAEMYAEDYGKQLL